MLVTQLFADGFVRLAVKRIELDLTRKIVAKLEKYLIFSLRRIFRLPSAMAQRQNETDRRSLR